MKHYRNSSLIHWHSISNVNSHLFHMEFVRHLHIGHWGQFYSSHTNQYCVCPPFDAMTARHRRLMLEACLLTSVIGMLFHSLCDARSRSRTLLTLWRSLTLRPKTSHMCSIGDKSGDRDGHSNNWTLLLIKTFIVYLAVCGLALACWIITPGRWRAKHTIQ